MPTPTTRFANLANLKSLFAGLKGKYEPKDSAIVKDASYVHTDTNFTQDEKTKLSGIATGATANAGTVTSVATGVGLTGGTVTSSGTVKANLKSETAHSASSATPTNTASRQYAVGVDADGYLSVNVPWVDSGSPAALTSTEIGNAVAAAME